MFFEPIRQTSLLVFCNILLILVLILITRSALNRGFLKRPQKFWSYSFIFIFCLFSFWGLDWFGYQQYFNDIAHGDTMVPMEDFYLWLGRNLCPNYLFFRAWVWGLALLLFYRTLKLIEADIDLTLFFFVSIFLIFFSYARATLAMAMMFCGFAELVTAKHKSKLHYILGIAFIVLSYFLHKSSPFGLIAIAFTLLISNFKKKTVIVSIAAFPLILYLFIVKFGGYIDLISADDTNFLNEYITTGSSYLNADGYAHGIGAILQRTLECSSYYLIFILCGLVLANSTLQINGYVKMFILLDFVLVLLASTFAFNSSLNTSVLYIRCLRYAQIPATISFAYIYAQGFYPKFSKFTLSVGLFSTLYSLLYVFYNLI